MAFLRPDSMIYCHKSCMYIIRLEEKKKHICCLSVVVVALAEVGPQSPTNSTQKASL